MSYSLSQRWPKMLRLLLAFLPSLRQTRMQRGHSTSSAPRLQRMGLGTEINWLAMAGPELCQLGLSQARPFSKGRCLMLILLLLVKRLLLLVLLHLLLQGIMKPRRPRVRRRRSLLVIRPVFMTMACTGSFLAFYALVPPDLSRLRRYFKPANGKSAASAAAMEMFNDKTKRFSDYIGGMLQIKFLKDMSWPRSCRRKAPSKLWS